jgi:DnaK suppressor protein
MEKEIDLDYFRSLLESRKDEIERNLSAISSDIEELQGLEVNDEGDFASISSSRYTDTMLATHQLNELKEIEHALQKVAKSSDLFGICEMCQDDIAKERLVAKPFAIYCKSCRELVEQRGKDKKTK